ncbi:hypothetical protein [Kocuria sp. KH4]
MEDGMLCVDLATEGTVITGNRTKTTAPADAMDPAEAPVDDAAPEVSADNDPDHL